MRSIFFCVLFVLCSGCGLNMEKHYRNYRTHLVARDFDRASEYIESQKIDFYGQKNRLLYYMDQGSVLHLGKRYRESNEFLEQAKAAAEELWTDSVGENAAAWLTTDNSLSYQGEDFEKVFIHLLAAFNYLELGDFSAARVEARQVTNKLELYNSKYEEKKNVYRDDAFARWLAGKLAATEKSTTALNDAWIDFRRSLEVYETDYRKRYNTVTPRIVIEDALQTLGSLGPEFAPELAKVSQQYPQISARAAKTPEDLSRLGEVVLIHLNGEAPYKVDQFWTATTGEEIIRIAYPEYRSKSHRVTGARVRVGTRQAVTEPMQPQGGIAVQNLNDKMDRIKTKAIARTIAKYAAQKALKEGGKAVANSDADEAKTAGTAMQVAGFLWNLGSVLAEEADKRAWLTLPDDIQVARLYVEPGPVSATVEFVDGAGQVLEVTELSGQAEAGQTLFFVYRTFQ